MTRKIMKKLNRNITFILFTSLFLFCFPVTGWTSEQFSEMSTEHALYVQGVISRFYPDEMKLSIRPPKGKLIRVQIDPDTILEGVTRVDELEKEQQVKVWFLIDADGKRALKIKKMMGLGC